ncbi:MAG: hypothetical protein RBR97_01685 [Bacteroidales bacterium]|nr:hypothetical protein [Bacteroidales bacterium]
MFNNSDTSIIRKSCILILEIIDFHNELILNGKKPIAVRILNSTLVGTTSLHKTLYATTTREFTENRKLAVKHLKNAIYWIQQCEKSGYYFDENILRISMEILVFCEDEEFVI